MCGCTCSLVGGEKLSPRLHHTYPQTHHTLALFLWKTYTSLIFLPAPSGGGCRRWSCRTSTGGRGQQQRRGAIVPRWTGRHLEASGQVGHLTVLSPVVYKHWHWPLTLGSGWARTPTSGINLPLHQLWQIPQLPVHVKKSPQPLSSL